MAAQKSKMSRKNTKGIAWSQADLDDLKASYPTTLNSELATRYGRTIEGIKHAALKVGVCKTPEFLHNQRAEVGRENMRVRAWKENHISSLRTMKPGRKITQYGYSDEQTISGGRIITHRLSDVHKRAV